MGTKDITQAARVLEVAERRFDKVVAAEDTFIEKAKARALAKAQTKYSEKLQDAKSAVAVAKAELQKLVADA